MHWSGEDVFKFHVTLKEQPCTRQGSLSVVSSMYDLLGFLAPVTFPAKHLLQELCRLNLSWDKDIPNTRAQSWKRWLQALEALTNFNIARSFKSKKFGKVEYAQLNHFCDASKVGRKSHCEVLRKSRIPAGVGKSAQWKEHQPEKFHLQTGSIP